MVIIFIYNLCKVKKSKTFNRNPKIPTSIRNISKKREKLKNRNVKKATQDQDQKTDPNHPPLNTDKTKNFKISKGLNIKEKCKQIRSLVLFQEIE